jgi:hypothetical protein
MLKAHAINTILEIMVQGYRFSNDSESLIFVHHFAIRLDQTAFLDDFRPVWLNWQGSLGAGQKQIEDTSIYRYVRRTSKAPAYRPPSSGLQRRHLLIGMSEGHP